MRLSLLVYGEVQAVLLGVDILAREIRRFLEVVQVFESPVLLPVLDHGGMSHSALPVRVRLERRDNTYCRFRVNSLSNCPDEENHADFLEAQLHSIKEMGIGPYLSQQLEK